MQRSFPYSKRSFVVNAIFIGLLICATAALALMTSIELPSLALIMVLEAALLVILGLSPFLTAHEIADGELILRQGWYFKATIPIAEIRSVSRLDKGPARTGVFFRLLNSTLFVTSRRYDLVELELRKKRKFGWALAKKADRIVFDAEDVPSLMKGLEGSGSLAPVQPYGP